MYEQQTSLWHKLEETCQNKLRGNKKVAKRNLRNGANCQTVHHQPFESVTHFTQVNQFLGISTHNKERLKWNGYFAWRAGSALGWTAVVSAVFWKHSSATESPEKVQSVSSSSEFILFFQSETKTRAADAPESRGYIVFLFLAAMASYNELCLVRKAEEAVVIIYFLLFKVAPLVEFPPPPPKPNPTPPLPPLPVSFWLRKNCLLPQNHFEWQWLNQHRKLLCFFVFVILLIEQDVSSR